jgi:opacity protein-like surface antigen
MRIQIRVGFAVVALLGAAQSAAAQAWDSPSFFAPLPGEDLGVFVTVPDGDDGGGDIGFQAIWRQEGNLNLGVRGGVGGVEGNRTILLGAEYYGSLPIASLPVNATWILGFGAGFDDEVTALRIPLGVSVGTYLGEGTGFRVQPYVHPRVAFDLVAVEFDDEEETDTDFSFAIDVGADIDLSESFAVKAGYTFALGPDFETDFDFYPNTFGAGIVYRMPRRVRSN